MKKSILYSAIATAATIGISACSSSGGGDTAGIGGSGITSSGTITGFGSIFVNGVEFETSSSTFSVDDNPNGTEDDLAVGMRVTVNGTLNADGVSGTATSVTFDDQLQGPVSGMTENLDLTAKTFTVLGITVKASSVDTSYDVSGSNPANPPSYSYADLVNGNNVEISGFFNTAGELEATRIELKDVTFDNSSVIELKGNINGLNPGAKTFNINGINVSATSATIEDLPNNELAENAFVEVKGKCADINCNPVNADRIEGESEGFDNDGDFEVEGLVTEFTGLANNFKVGNFPVNASTTSSFEPASLQTSLANDIKVEVEGTVVNGVLNADEVKLRGGDNEVHGTVFTLPANNQFEVLVDRDDNETVTIIVSTETEVEDDVNENQSFSISNLQIDDFVEVRGYADTSNDVTATQVKLTDLDDFIVQGVITDLSGDASSGTATVLGIPFEYIGGADATDFEDQSDTGVTFNTFEGLIEIDKTVVKIKDKETTPNAIGTADEIEIEN